MRPPKRCRAQRRVRAFQLVARARHRKTLTSESRCKKKNRPRLSGGRCRQEKKKLLERPFCGRDSCNEKKKRTSPKNKNSQAALLRTLQLRSSLAGPRMALRPGRRTSPSARLSPSRRILPVRKCTSQQPLQLAIRLRRDLIMARGGQCESTLCGV